MALDPTGALRRSMYLRGLRATTRRHALGTACLLGAAYLCAIVGAPGWLLLAVVFVAGSQFHAAVRSALALADTEAAARRFYRGED